MLFSLFASLSFSLLIGQAPRPLSYPTSVVVAQSVSQDIHTLCLAAKDYAGCVRANAGASVRPGGLSQDQRTGKREQCSKRNVCIAKSGKDQLGLPKVVGWFYKYFPSQHMVLYWQMTPKRIPHKGQSDRYVALKHVEHYYQQPISATPGYYQEISPKKKTCLPVFGGGTWVNGQWKPKPAGQTCTTTAAKKVWVAGTPAIPGGPRSRSWIGVYDCVDRTKAQYINRKLKGNWSSMTSSDSSLCTNRSSLDVLNMKL